MLRHPPIAITADTYTQRCPRSPGKPPKPLPELRLGHEPELSDSPRAPSSSKHGAVGRRLAAGGGPDA